MKTPRFAAFLAALMTTFACTGLLTPGTDDNTTPAEENNNNEENKEEVFTIQPTSISLEAVEGDFQITVTSSQEYDITIVDEWITEVSRSGKPATGETIVFHATENISAGADNRSGVISVCTKNGSCNPVMVDQTGAFPRKLLAMRFTATWCGYCPYMDEAFHKVAEQSEDFTYVTFHASQGYPLYFSDCEALVGDYNIQGYPTGVVAGWKPVENYTNTDYTASNIIDVMSSFADRFPAAALINGKASIKDGKISVDASVTPTMDGDFKVVALVLESGIVQTQSYYPTTGGSQSLTDFVHDNIARKTLTESIQGDELPENGQFHWETDLNSSWNKDNLSVMIWVTKNYGKLLPYKAVKLYPSYYISNACNIKVAQ